MAQYWLTPREMINVDEPPQVDQVGDGEQKKAAGTDRKLEGLADLVAEAVATYQEQHGQVADDGDVDGEPETASFPMLAKALVAGEGVPVDDMRSALENPSSPVRTFPMCSWPEVWLPRPT